ncbi:MAG TPA: mechanosensitive ion channel protein MscS [Betaproteobacteria bacterium]|nr:mechanosensitive ion channel protein MscS [Betaproteobacteria bacterium]
MSTFLHVLFILILAVAAVILLRKGINFLIQQWRRRAVLPESIKRIETLRRVLRYTATVVIAIIAGTLALSALGIAIGPILGTAGILGLAISFGAKNLVQDYFNGFFLLLENQIRQGDVIAVADKAGLVEEVTFRYVRLRDYSGNVHFIPNSAITTVTNMSWEYAYSVFEIGIAYRENIAEAFGLIRQVSAELRADPEFSQKILDDVEIAGLDKWGESALILKGRFKTAPLEQWGVRREFLRRLKQTFDDHGVEIPFPHLTVYAGQSKGGGAPPFHWISEEKHRAVKTTRATRKTVKNQEDRTE